MDITHIVTENVRTALAEDIGSGDLTAALIPVDAMAEAYVISREAAVICGRPWVDEVFRQLDSRVEVDWHVVEGDRVEPEQELFRLHGSARALLTGERTALNFLQCLSGTATQARRYADAVAGLRIKILDTRKTIPGLRLALKYAVKTGGGVNHRIGLYDGILIKENHIAAAGGVDQVLKRASANNPGIPIQIEVETLEQLEQAIASGAKLILLDNFTPARMIEAVKVTAGRAALEASGGITLKNVREIADTGVDRISIGALTHSPKSVDFSMEFKK